MRRLPEPEIEKTDFRLFHGFRPESGPHARTRRHGLLRFVTRPGPRLRRSGELLREVDLTLANSAEAGPYDASTPGQRSFYFIL